MPLIVVHGNKPSFYDRNWFSSRYHFTNASYCGSTREIARVVPFVKVCYLSFAMKERWKLNGMMKLSDWVVPVVPQPNGCVVTI